MTLEKTSLRNYLSPQDWLSAKAEKLRRQANRVPDWPETYINSETGHIYKPHNEAEQSWAHDADSRYSLLKGGEGCLYAKTPIDGGYLADCPEAILRGSGKLYKLIAESGAEVMVTASHRVLTPVGWRQLADLSSGDVIAGYGSDCDPLDSGTDINYQDHCYASLHPCGELLSPSEVVALDRLRLLHRLAFDNSACLCPPASDGHSRFCKKHSSFLWEPLSWLIAAEFHEPEADDEYARLVSHNLKLFLRTILQLDNAQLSHPLEDHISERRLSEPDTQVLSEAVRHIGGKCLDGQLFGTATNSVDGIEELFPEYRWSFPEQSHAFLERKKYSSETHQSSDEFPSELVMGRNDMPQVFPLLASPYKYSNTKWTVCKEISFFGEGEYYDVEVPFLECYGAAGLIHHNSGKTTAGVVRDLNRIRHGAHGICVSPDFEHFKRSLWPEFRRWCPWEFVVEKQRYRQSIDWEPNRPFQLVFTTGAVVYFGGMKETEVMAWEGPNVNFAHFDECRRHKTPAAIKVLDGRVRIQVGELNPQIWLTTTPRKHWLFEFFGPMIENDPKADFKNDALVMTLLTIDNEMNLSPDFVRQRRQTLTEAEARVLLEAEWEDIEDTDRFLPSMIWWDNLKAAIPALTKREPMVVAVDAAVGRQTGYSDCFGIIGVTRHPDPKYRKNQVFVRYVRKWQARPGHKINFDEPREELRKLCREFNIVMVCYDNYQLHDMMSGLASENIAWFKEFSQGARRLQADRQLLDLILEQRVWHDGNPDLREHIDNADKKLADDGRRIRIVKREEALKNDLAVSLSMATYENLRLNI